MIMLNSRELKEFETVYQGLRNHPAWTMENIFYENSYEFNEFKKCSRIFRARDAQNRLTVATHESAHCVVLAATYQNINAAVIDLEGDELLGLVLTGSKNKDSSDHQSVKQYPNIPRPLISMNTLVLAAGFVGESFVGRKTGSYHEKFLVFCQTRYLDDKDGLEPMTSWKHYIAWTKHIIKNNENLFWRIIDDLLKHSKLTNEIKCLLHNKIRRESPDKFFNEELK